MTGAEIEPHALPQHPLFATHRWEYMLRSTSAYFDGPTVWELHRNSTFRTLSLTVRANLKNYGGEIEAFVDWLAPHLQTRGFIGFKRCEDHDHPTLIYNVDGVIHYRVLNDLLTGLDAAYAAK